MQSYVNRNGGLGSKGHAKRSTLIVGCMFAVLGACNIATASQVTYHMTTQSPLYASNLELLGAVTDISEAQYWPEYDVYFSTGGSASAQFTYDNSPEAFNSLSGIEVKVGDFVVASDIGIVVVADGSFNPNVPYDPLAPTTDGISLLLAHESFPGISGFSIGDWTLDLVLAHWYGGEFISGEDIPSTLPPAPGYEVNVLTFVFSNASGDSASITAAGMEVAPVPVPAAAWLFGSALIGVFGISRKR